MFLVVDNCLIAAALKLEPIQQFLGLGLVQAADFLHLATRRVRTYVGDEMRLTGDQRRPCIHAPGGLLTWRRAHGDTSNWIAWI